MNSFYLGEEFALQQLNDFNQWIRAKHKRFIGYPCNAAFKLNKFFQWWTKSSLSKSPLNEVGDPNAKSSYTLNAHPFERIVLQFFANLYSLKPHWGYITSGGTQGNEQGLYMGRCVLEKHGRPILYFSEEAHYSIASLGKVLDLDSCVIHSTPSGEMDYSNLKQKLDATRPALFSLSIGTTFKGAIDRIEIVQSIVREKGIKHIFYHADAALFGGYLPFYKSRAKPDLNFKRYPYDSMAVSGHKFFGSPTPLGIFLIRKGYADDIKTEYIEYIDCYNKTIPCSRSALNTLILWWIIATTPREEFVKETNQILKNARYFYEELRKRRYPAWLNAYSNTLFFQAPSPDLCKRWTLSLQAYPKLGLLAHAIVMQHVDKKMIDEFLHDLDQERSITIQKTRFTHSDS
jgi:histidine decarboxylase